MKKQAKKKPAAKAAKKVAKKTTTKKAVKKAAKPALITVSCLFYNTEQKHKTKTLFPFAPYTGTRIKEPYEGVVTLSQKFPPYIEVLMPPVERNGVITL